MWSVDRFGVDDLTTNVRAAEIRQEASAPQPFETDLLGALGKRVREFRNHRGMTRKLVAREAGVSERHLAQLEAGEGNISVVLLRRIAAALNVSLAELFSRDADNTPELQRLERILQRVPPHRLEEVAARLMREFGPSENGRRERIALIGLRGAGKSTMGSRLAKDLKVPFIELDREIEKDAGMALSEIFSLYGQTGYRRVEKRTLEHVLQEHAQAVISVGGGVVSEPDTYERLLADCCTIWVKAQPEEHMSRVIAQGDFRAMAGNAEAMEDLRRILEAREPLYRRADFCLDTSGESADESFAKLKQALQSRAQ